MPVRETRSWGGLSSWGGPGIPLKRVLFTLHHDYRKKNQNCKKRQWCLWRFMCLLSGHAPIIKIPFCASKKKKIQRTDRNFYKLVHGESLNLHRHHCRFCNFGSFSGNHDAKWKEPSWGGQSPFWGGIPLVSGFPVLMQVSKSTTGTGSGTVKLCERNGMDFILPGQ